MSKPNISVLMVNYNHGKYLTQSIQGVLSQSFENFEFLIHDDGSTDNSREIIEAFAHRDSRIKYIFSEENVGSFCGMSRLMAKACGDNFVMTAADDYFADPNAFGDLQRALNMYPAAGLAYGTSIEIDGNREDKELWPYGHAHRQGLISGAEFLESYFKGLLNLNMFACIWRRKSYERVGSLDVSFGSVADTHCMAKIGVCEGVVFVDKKYSCARILKGRYGDSGGSLLWLKRHALLEAELISILKDFSVPYDWRYQFRKRLIDYKYRTNWCQEFLLRSRECFESLDYWREYYMHPDYSKFKQTAVEECERLSRQLELQVKLAYEMFEDTAGRL
jgi:glycosyltransferase involved in cell wall biosynthesis